MQQEEADDKVMVEGAKEEVKKELINALDTIAKVKDAVDSVVSISGNGKTYRKRKSKKNSGRQSIGKDMMCRLRLYERDSDFKPPLKPCPAAADEPNPEGKTKDHSGADTGD